MKISKELKIELEEIYQTFLNDEKIKRMKDINMHRGSNCFEHSFKVAKKAIRWANRSRRKINFQTLLIGAILHDYYLYDWRKDRSKKKRHGRNHPSIAAENASRDFAISKDIKYIIKTHMWPINSHSFPKTIEAKIVSMCDKAVTVGESLTSIKFKEKRRAKYQKYLSLLFA